MYSLNYREVRRENQETVSLFRARAHILRVTHEDVFLIVQLLTQFYR